MICYAPWWKKRSKLSGLQRERNEYTKYARKIEKLSKQIGRLDGWYDTHAKNRKKYALRPGAINANSVNLYYSPEMIGYADAAVEKSDFDRHMYSKSSFEASVYKHVKGVWIKSGS